MKVVSITSKLMDKIRMVKANHDWLKYMSTSSFKSLVGYFLIKVMAPA